PGKDFQQLYDSANLYPNQLFLRGEWSNYLSIVNSLTLKSTFYGGYIYAPRVFRNEVFQIGGSKLLRGFDEQSLFVNDYAVLSLELRYYLARNSFVHVFSDNAHLRSEYSAYRSKGFYHGFGAGVSFENKTGLFSITYALGAAPGQPAQLRQS